MSVTALTVTTRTEGRGVRGQPCTRSQTSVICKKQKKENGRPYRHTCIGQGRQRRRLFCRLLKPYSETYMTPLSSCICPSLPSGLASAHAFACFGSLSRSAAVIWVGSGGIHQLVNQMPGEPGGHLWTHLGVDVARRDRVDTYRIFPEFAGHASSHLKDGGLGSVVCNPVVVLLGERGGMQHMSL